MKIETIKAGSLSELLEKIASLAGQDDPRKDPEVDVEADHLEHSKDVLDTMLRTKIARLVLENVRFSEPAKLRETMDTVYDFVMA